MDLHPYPIDHFHRDLFRDQDHLVEFLYLVLHQIHVLFQFHLDFLLLHLIHHQHHYHQEVEVSLDLDYLTEEYHLQHYKKHSLQIYFSTSHF